jgi:hypothetical protein
MDASVAAHYSCAVLFILRTLSGARKLFAYENNNKKNEKKKPKEQQKQKNREKEEDK